MKTQLVSLLILLSTLNVLAQEKSPNIVFDVTSTDVKVHKSVMLMMKVMSANYPEATFEVMVYGEALPMLMRNQSTVADQVALYKDNDNVKFTACEVSMRLIFNIDKTRLLDGVGTIENAVPEIAQKQRKGWGYIKTGS